jgi:HK97 family phage prohead protease
MEEKRIKYFSVAAKTVDEDKRILRFVGSTEDVDRDNEVIKASGWKLKNYRKNPVVLVNHSHFDLPVAKTKKVWVEDKKLKFDIEFPEADVHPQGDTLYKLYKNGYMNATSVGFIPNMQKAVFGEKQGEPNITFKDQELLEISLVSVPANPQALLTSKSVKKAIKDEVIDDLELKDLDAWLSMQINTSTVMDEDFDEKKEEKDEKEEKIVNTEKDSEIQSQDDDKSISNSSEDKQICKDCGVEITLCPSCFQKSEDENIFRKIYESLLDK